MFPQWLSGRAVKAIDKEGKSSDIDLFWYDNDFATGAQLYPKGIHLYHDMYALDGLTMWLNDL